MWEMFYKKRSEPADLTLLRFLSMRMDLSPEDKNNYLNLEKGFIGEQKFDVLLESLPKDWLILNDLLLKHKNSYFQIDTTLISQDRIFLIDVKNYEGDFYIEGEHWYTLSKVEITDPLQQLKRCESLLRRFLHDLGFHSLTIESHLVFINPEFQLYQAPKNLPIIFPAQLNRFMNQLKMKKINLKDNHLKLAEQLVASHILKSPFTQVPEYRYEQMKKGIIFWECGSFVEDCQGELIVCNNCGCKEGIQPAVLRSVDELRLLFPDGIKPAQYNDLGVIVRVWDKLKRIANGNQGEENAWQDIAGYAILMAKEDDF
jgi:hypothetical protein